MFGRVKAADGKAGYRLSRWRVAALALGLATLFGLANLVPVTSGPLSAVAYANDFPKSCGREGQTPCPLFGPNRHVPSCMPGLVERPFGKRCSRKKPPPPVFENLKKTLSGSKLNPNNQPNCGGQGQKPCLAPILPSCDKGLVQHFIKNRCIINDDDIVFMARNTIREVGPVLRTIALGVVDCGIETLVSKINTGNRAMVVREIQERPCFNALLDQARQNGYQTLSLGASGGGAIGVGVDGENGFAFDTARRLPVQTYHTLGLSFGSFGAGSAVTVGLGKGPNNTMAGDGHGATVGFAAVGGSGASVSFDYGSAEVSSISAVITAGAKFSLAYFRNTTKTLSTYPVVAANSLPSGGYNQVETYQPSRPRRPVGPTISPAPARNPVDTFAENHPQAHAAAENVGFALGNALGRMIAQNREDARPRTTFDICNNTQHKKIFVSWIYKRPNGNKIADRWRARGNFTVKRGECYFAGAKNWVGTQGYEGPVFFYASTDHKSRKKGQFADWQGDGLEFCVAHKKKKFTHKSGAAMRCDPKYGRMVRGYRMDVGPGRSRFTFND